MSLVDYSLVEYQVAEKQVSWVQQFYTIGLKRNMQEKFHYGQQQYDFDEKLLKFIGPNQHIHFEVTKQDLKPTSWLLCIHPDFLWSTSLAKNIKSYDFFYYSVNETLFLSDKEEGVSEIAYGLGFEHSQSFSRLFKSKTKLSPLAFRAN